MTRRVRFSAGRDSEWSSRYRQACKADSNVHTWSSGKEKYFERCEERELNGIGEERNDMSDEEGDRMEDEGEFAAPDWRVSAGPRNKPTQREREEHEATHMPFRDWCAHCMMGRGRTHHHIAKQKSEDESRRPIIAIDYFFMTRRLPRVPNQSQKNQSPLSQ